MRDWENASWAAGRAEADVIRRVGGLVAAKILTFTRADDFILLLAGKGHNGDDVRAAKDILAGRRMELLNVTAPAEALPKLETLLARRPVLVVDGLFGIGLDRPLDADWSKFVDRLNTARLPVLAVDIPSGLDADTGEPLPVAVRAAHTLTVGAVKRGLLLPGAAAFVGRLEVAADVGLIPCPAKSELNWLMKDDFTSFPPPREVTAYKGSFGHLAIIAGSLGFHGAAVLAARGAQRARPGLITLFPREDVFHPVAAQLQSVMVSTAFTSATLPGNFSGILIGPGLAAPGVVDELRTILRRIWLDAPCPVVVDASALDWLPIHPVPSRLIRVITPHPGEAARLLKTTTEKIQTDRPYAVREISRLFGNCWVVLKGHQTLIGRSTGDILVNATGNPHLAQGGSGDLLAGYLAGLLAQPALQADSLKTITYAVWQHGAAADRLDAARENWIVEDLVEDIGRI